MGGETGSENKMMLMLDQDQDELYHGMGGEVKADVQMAEDKAVFGTEHQEMAV